MVSTDRLKERKEELEAELRKGHALLRQQEATVAQTRQTLQNLGGAVKVLDELLSEAAAEREEP